MTRFVIHPDSGKCAMFEPLAGGSDEQDINDVQNAPLKNPELHLDKVHFHSEMNYLEVIFEASKTIAHGVIAVANPPTSSNSGSGSGSGSSAGLDGSSSTVIDWRTTVVDSLLFTHNLGYEPDVLVVLDGDVVSAGMPIQTSNGSYVASRHVAVYVTPTQIRLYETKVAGSSTLAGISKTYDILVFKNQHTPSSALSEYDPVTEITTMGYGKFRSDKKYLQKAVGGSPFNFSVGRDIDAKNGALRYIKPDGSVYDPIPSGTKHYMWGKTVGASDMAYNGNFSGEPAIQVQAP